MVEKVGAPPYQLHTLPDQRRLGRRHLPAVVADPRDPGLTHGRQLGEVVGLGGREGSTSCGGGGGGPVGHLAEPPPAVPAPFGGDADLVRHGAHQRPEVPVHIPPHKGVDGHGAKDDGDPPAVRQGVPQIRTARVDPAPVAADRLHPAQARGDGCRDDGDHPDGPADEELVETGGRRHVGRPGDGQERHDGDDQDREVGCLYRELTDEAIDCTGGTGPEGMVAEVY